MGRLKKLLNLLVLAVAGIVIWHEFIEPQRQTSTDSGKTGGGGDAGRSGGGTSPWDGVPSARDIVKSVTGEAAGEGPAGEGLAAVISAVNTVTERVTAVADELAARRSEESGKDTGSSDNGSSDTESKEASDPRQMSSTSRSQGTDAGGETAGDAGSRDQGDTTASSSSGSPSHGAGKGSGASGLVTGAVAETAGESGSEGARGSATEAVANTVADAVPVDTEATSGGSTTTGSQADDRTSGGGPGRGGPAKAAFADGELAADIGTATSSSETATELGTPATGANAAPRGDEGRANDGSGAASSGAAGADTGARAGGSGAPVSVPTGAVQGDGTADCPGGFPIKGNATSRIYHEPGRASYDRTIPEFCFETVEAAEAAGFRAPKH